MLLYSHELKRNRLSLLIWTGAISFMLVVCVIIYPEMSSQMDAMSQMFSEMGAFSEAFGMDMLDMGDFLGYFAVECGEMLGIGGGLFAAILGISALSKEEGGRTADFLLTHPVSRTKVVLQKLLSVYTLVLLFDVIVIAVTLCSVYMIGEQPDLKKLFLLFLSYFLLQLEVASITFGISAFLKRRGIGLGIGIPLFFYFANLISNITEKAEFVKYLTPYAYTDGASIIENEALDMKHVCIGVAVSVLCVAAAFVKYNGKDIEA